MVLTAYLLQPGQTHRRISGFLKPYTISQVVKITSSRLTMNGVARIVALCMVGVSIRGSRLNLSNRFKVDHDGLCLVKQLESESDIHDLTWQLPHLRLDASHSSASNALMANATPLCTLMQEDPYVRRYPAQSVPSRQSIPIRVLDHH